MEHTRLRNLVQNAKDIKDKTNTKAKKSPAKKEAPKTTYQSKKVCCYVREDLWDYVKNLAYTERKQIANMVEEIIVEYQQNHLEKELIERPSGFRRR